MDLSPYPSPDPKIDPRRSDRPHCQGLKLKLSFTKIVKQEQVHKETLKHQPPLPMTCREKADWLQFISRSHTHRQWGRFRISGRLPRCFVSTLFMIMPPPPCSPLTLIYTPLPGISLYIKLPRSHITMHTHVPRLTFSTYTVCTCITREGDGRPG